MAYRIHFQTTLTILAEYFFMGNKSKPSIFWIDNQILFSEIEKMLAEGRQASFTVVGYSMYPFLVSGRDSVVIEHPGASKPRKGDIVLFKPLPNRYMLHRVTRLTQEGFETTGDRHTFRDGVFPYESIVGRVTAIVRKGKTIPCSDLWYRFLVMIWGLILPFRTVLIGTWGKIRCWRH